jgi:hypothetical protein
MTLIFRNPHRRDAMILARLAGARNAARPSIRQTSASSLANGKPSTPTRLSQRVIGCEVRAAITLAARIAQAEDDRLTAAAVVDLNDAGKRDEAERAASDRLVRFLDRREGYDRLGMVRQARREDSTGRRLLSQGHRLHSPASRRLR